MERLMLILPDLTLIDFVFIKTRPSTENIVRLKRWAWFISATILHGHIKPREVQRNLLSMTAWRRRELILRMSVVGKGLIGMLRPVFEPKVDTLSWGREKWFPWWEAEHNAAREGVILMDMSFMSKFMVQGRDAGKVLNYISANNVDDQANQITYTQWLNEAGKLEADLTVTKLNKENYLVVVTDTMHRHAETWLKRHISEDDHAFVTDLTSAYGQLNIQGPKSRELIANYHHNRFIKRSISI